MIPRFHCLTDVPDAGQPLDGRWSRQLAAVVEAGVDAVQVRAKHLSDRALCLLAEEVVRILGPSGARVIVNDRVDVALAAGAHGVHLGLDDIPVRAARRAAPPGFLVGATCRSSEHARRARAEGADYAGVGPLYRSSTKAGLPDPIGHERIREVAEVLPVIGISGITADRVPEVLAGGAHGVAVTAAVWRSPDPPGAAKEIADLVHSR